MLWEFPLEVVVVVEFIVKLFLSGMELIGLIILILMQLILICIT